MADEPEKIWDEYDWERFLQQQDRKTEQYMELLEKYLDHPDRDEIIAREMGWTHLLGDEGKAWAENVDAAFFEETDADDDDEEDEGEEPDETAGIGFEAHPLYRASFAVTVWIDQLFEDLPELQNEPAAVELATQSAIASAKLAAALSDCEIDEIGMTIAYLKRGLKAVSNAIEATVSLRRAEKIDRGRFNRLNQRLFQVRDAIISLMGEYRSRWRREHEG